MNKPVVSRSPGQGPSPDLLTGLTEIARQIEALGPLPAPADLLWKLMRPSQVTPSSLALDLKVPHSRVSEILNPQRRRAVSPDTALRLEDFYGMPALIWLLLQAAEDLREARKRLRTAPLTPLPVPSTQDGVAP